MRISPPFPFPPKGDRRKGREVPPRRQKRRLPLQEGFQSALLKTPLLSPDGSGTLTKRQARQHEFENAADAVEEKGQKPLVSAFRTRFALTVES